MTSPLPAAGLAADASSAAIGHVVEKRSAEDLIDSLSPLPTKRPRASEVDVIDAALSGLGEWAEVISKLKPAIVALKVTCVRSFEEDSASTSLGTGFVVDCKCGIILTNRHVTGVGPVRATAIFDRHEELEVEVLYRDPVHDFGFFRYDPSKLRMTCSVEVPLDPEGLRVGTEIRVVGNDAGEKLQILAGTIARVDRNVPEFCSVYNDENTFYAGAGAGTSGGSSGSPVLSRQGRAVALNAAGTEGTMGAFFLPLDRVRYSFELLRGGQPVTRGTCMASFLFKPFDELIRVGLQERHERCVRDEVPDATGMLIVDGVLCEQRLLRPGDILLRLQGRICIHFAALEGVLDGAVGSSVQLLVCRAGEEVELAIPVSDLHTLIPRSFVELGLDVLHGIGYHAAKRAHLPLDTGMYLARCGYVFDSLGCGRASLVTTVGTTPVPTPEALVEAIKDVPDRQYIPVSWYELADFRRDRALRTGFAKVSRAWSPLRLWRCEGTGGGSAEKWVPTDLPEPSKPARGTAVASGTEVGFTGGDPLVRKLQGSLVTVRFRTDRRFCTEASLAGSSEGFGVLLDARSGLVLTDRHSAPQSLGDVEVTLAGAATVDAEVIFVHPQHNLAIVRCEAKSLACLHEAGVRLRPAQIATGAKASLRAGEAVHFVGFDNQGNTFSSQVRIAAVYLPSGRDEFPLWDVPRFRERNLEIAVLADTPEDARGGVLCDSSGAIRALFAAFDWQSVNREETTEAFGIPANVFGPLVNAMRLHPGVPPSVRSLEIEVNAIDVATLARGAAGKLPRAWLEAVGRQCGRQGQAARALRVHRINPKGASCGCLKPGDVLLSVAGHTIACALDIEVALQPSSHKVRAKAKAKGKAKGKIRRPALAQQLGDHVIPQEVPICVFRDGQEVEVKATPATLTSEDDDRLVIWAGLVLRCTPRCIMERCSDVVAKAAGGVFIHNVLGGSPADAREMIGHCFLMEIGSRPLRDLGDVLEAAAAVQSEPVAAQEAAGCENGSEPLPARAERRWVRLRLLDLYGQEHVRALQSDPLFFPTLDLRRGDGGAWRCVQLS